ncbi:MAG: FMN reductase [Methylocystis sp.]|uniref:FMN reductase n=1 Tax=Methylocystis sp. TaxID=1911079 RepID=UPI003DA31DA5
MSKLNVVAVSGGLSKPSKSAVLASAIVDQIARIVPVETTYIEVSSLLADLPAVSSASHAPSAVIKAIQAIETADALVVSTPVYRASYTGLFKHLFDLVHYEALIDKPILLAATGGSERHALVLEHQLRPLFSFFQALTLPVGVFASDRDFENYQIVNESLKDRISVAAGGAAKFLTKHASYAL